MISGEAGVGKTSLVEELSRRRSVGADVVGPVRPAADAAGARPGARRRPCAPAATSRSSPTATTGISCSPSSSRVCSIDGPPTVVVLEDLQWADAATLDFLAFAGRRIERTRCVLVVTYRDDLRARPSPARRCLGELATVRALRQAQARSVERERSRDARGVDAVGSERRCIV